jgi:Protein of unknown function (DUF1566)
MKKVVIIIISIISSMSLIMCGPPDEPEEIDGCYETSSTITTTNSTGNYNIVDTNQIRCFDSSSGTSIICSGTSFYDADVNGKQPDYTNGTGTVTDNITGLMWTQSTDTNSDGSVNSSDKMTQKDAVAYCNNLSLGGYEDWRLPDIKTLYSLIMFNGEDPSGYEGTDTSVLIPFGDDIFDWAFGDTDANERIIDGQYASTTTYVYYTNLGGGNTKTMFGVNFIDGRIKGYPCNGPSFMIDYYVRCVRGNTEYGLNNFSLTDNNSTISDLATGLMWEQSDNSSTDWDDAVQVCKDATTGNHDDWRLPNVKELQSIMDYSRSPDTDDSAAIDPIFSVTSITNESGGNDYPWYWASTTHIGYNKLGNSGTYVAFGRGLGYVESELRDVHGAGTQRSNFKLDVSSTPGASSTEIDGNGLFYYHGPQGDILRLNNYVRCVRDAL